MGEVEEEELAQWIQGMLSLYQEHERILKRIEDSRNEGLATYVDAIAQAILPPEGELPAVLEGLRKMPLPKESVCKRVKQHLEWSIENEIKYRAFDVKFFEGVEEGSLSRITAAKMAMLSQLAVSWLEESLKGFVSLRKKYQI